MKKQTIRTLLLLLAWPLLLTPVASAQVTISNGEDVSFNVGFMAQAWGRLE